ncbi:Uncharacterized protein FWK35_00024137 [Aphis craccivora]|uniref:Uncharacterized protein n=1 Tax=Aphis craccivora TaxID=307492 RepID=A0A6G0VTE0_APHCR|nr:Uncharacterized protein FWK35_00024137 [Aphis craccivora]
MTKIGCELHKHYIRYNSTTVSGGLDDRDTGNFPVGRCSNKYVILLNIKNRISDYFKMLDRLVFGLSRLVDNLLLQYSYIIFNILLYLFNNELKKGAIANKRKRGAEKARDKNKKLLLASAKQCLTLNELLKPQKQSLNKKCLTRTSIMKFNTEIRSDIFGQLIYRCAIENIRKKVLINFTSKISVIVNDNANTNVFEEFTTTGETEKSIGGLSSDMRKIDNDNNNKKSNDNVFGNVLVKAIAENETKIMDQQDNVFYKNVHNIDTNNYFQKPSHFMLDQFFEFHHIQLLVEHLFKSSKAYFRKNKTNRC